MSKITLVKLQECLKMKLLEQVNQHIIQRSIAPKQRVQEIWCGYTGSQSYRTKTGELKKSLLKSDLIKIITSLGIGEVVYTIVRWVLQYYLLQIDYDAYLASIISQLISTIVYLAVLNLSVKMTKLYKDE